MKKPNYKTLTFATEEAFNKWLEKTASAKIEFTDYGQDLLVAYIDEHGEILHTNMQQSVWCGQFINLETLAVGAPIDMQDDDGLWMIMFKLVPEKVITINKN